ncbi:hypothetical protein J7L02_02610 [Candidatus Woesearchaeota archaeon]|nr:hypothetical protein [Candidatus Woesearchaeota archaeon]
MNSKASKPRSILTQTNSFLALITIAVIVTLFSTSKALAVIEVQYLNQNFDVSFKPLTKTCACSQQVLSLNIKNTGNVVQTFNIQYALQKKFKSIKASVASVTLTPGQEQELQLPLNIPCDPGVYKLNIYVTNNAFLKTFSQELIVERCENLKLTLTNTTIKIPFCGNVTIPLVVSNIGLFQEQYELEIKQPKHWQSMLAESKLVLQPNTSKTINLTIKPDCDFYGDKTLTLKARALKNNVQTKIPLHIIVERKALFNVQFQDQEICNDFENKLPLTIQNNASFTDTYILKLKVTPERKKWLPLINTERQVLLVDREIVLNPGQEGTVFIKTLQGVKPGFYNLTIIVTSKNGLSKVLHSKLFVKKCFDIQSDFKAINNELCVNQTFQFKIFNKAQEPLRCVLKSEGFSMISNDSLTNALELNLSSQPLTITGLAQKPGTINLELIITSQLNNATLTKIFEKTVVVNNLEQCLKPRLEQISVKQGFQGVKALNVNPGVAGAVYELSFTTPSWITALNNTLTLQPGSKAKIYFNINTSNASIGSYDLTIVFKPLKTSLNFKNINISKEFVLKTRINVKGPSVFEKVLAWLGLTLVNVKHWFVKTFSKPCSLVSLILVISIVITMALLLLLRSGVEKTRPNTGLVIASSLLLILVFITSFAIVARNTGLFQALQEKQPIVKDLTIMIPCNKQAVLNLSKYFYDPDRDVLTFSYSITTPMNLDKQSQTFQQAMQDLQFLSIDINNSIAVIKPLQCIQAEFGVMFIASDAKGGFAKSPLFKVFILKQENIFELVAKNYCWYLNLVLFGLLLLSIEFLIAELSKQEKYKPVILQASKVKAKTAKSSKRKTSRLGKRKF